MSHVLQAPGGLGRVAAAAAAPSTTARVRLWPSVAAAGGGAVSPLGVRYPTAVERGLVGAAMVQLAALHVASKTRMHTEKVIEAAKPFDVCVDALADRPISDLIAALRDAGWISPELASTSVVVVPSAAPGAAAAPPVMSMPGIAHMHILARGSSVDVYEVFGTTPWPLYRTVEQDRMAPFVLAAGGGNAFSAVAPIESATFSFGELDLGLGGFFSAALTGLSVARDHEGTRHPPPPPLMPAAALLLPGPAAAALLTEALDRSDTRPLVVSCDLGVFPGGSAPRGILEPLSAAILVPTNGFKKTQALFCYELPVGTDLATIGFCAVYDCNSKERMGHVSLQRLGPLEVVPWVMDATQMMSRQPGAAPAAAASAEVFTSGAAGRRSAPLLAACFKMHCFLLRGRAGFTRFFDPDEPGADVDIADALEACASLAPDPENDSSLRRLLEGCDAARYSLARMDSELRGELALAFERTAAATTVATAAAAGGAPAPEDALAVARGSARLSEWAAGVDGTGAILLYASGPEPRAAAAAGLLSGSTTVPAELRSLLRAFMSAPPGSLSELLSVAASSAPRARALLRRCAEGDAAPTGQPFSPARLSHLWSALAAPNASVQSMRAHSMELLLRGIPLSEMAGVMSDLEDPLAQRILLTCAMLALDQPTTDATVFVFAAPTPSPALDESAAVAAVSAGSGQCFVRFFRAAARPLPVLLQAAEAAERTLDDVSAGMWGLPAGLTGSFVVLTGARVLLPEEQAPPYAQLLRDCALACCFEDAAVDVGAGGTLALRAQPGEALVVLLTRCRRTAVDAPALVVRLLRAHGFPDARIGGAWESGAAAAALAVTRGVAHPSG